MSVGVLPSSMQRRGFLAALLALAGGCLGDGRPGNTPTRARTDSPTRQPTAARTDATPRVRFDVAWDAAADAATITHAGGGELTAATTDRLGIVVTTWPDRPIPDDVTITPTKTPTTWRTTWRAAGGTYPIREGDAVGLPDATPGDEVVVRWHGLDGREGVLARAKLPKIEG